jgi:hypothetical protein
MKKTGSRKSRGTVPLNADDCLGNFYAFFDTAFVKPTRQARLGQVSTLAMLICAGIFKQYMGARNRVGIGLSYLPARLNSLAELVPWNRFLGSLKV